MKSGESEGNELREWTLRVQEIVHGFLGFNMGDPKPQASGTVHRREGEAASGAERGSEAARRAGAARTRWSGARGGGERGLRDWKFYSKFAGALHERARNAPGVGDAFNVFSLLSFLFLCI